VGGSPDTDDFRRFLGDDPAWGHAEDEAGADFDILIGLAQIVFLDTLAFGDAGVVVAGFHNVDLVAIVHARERFACARLHHDRRGFPGSCCGGAGVRGCLDAPVQEVLVDEDESHGNNVDEEDDGERAGNFRTAVIGIDFARVGGGGHTLFAAAGDGTEFVEHAFGDRLALDGECVGFHDGVCGWLIFVR
jgi:hypothetical protein